MHTWKGSKFIRNSIIDLFSIFFPKVFPLFLFSLQSYNASTMILAMYFQIFFFHKIFSLGFWHHISSTQYRYFATSHPNICLSLLLDYPFSIDPSITAGYGIYLIRSSFMGVGQTDLGYAEGQIIFFQQHHNYLLFIIKFQFQIPFQLQNNKTKLLTYVDSWVKEIVCPMNSMGTLVREISLHITSSLQTAVYIRIYLYIQLYVTKSSCDFTHTPIVHYPIQY